MQRLKVNSSVFTICATKLEVNMFGVLCSSGEACFFFLDSVVSFLD